MDLIYLFKSLLRRKWLIIISTLVAVLAAFFLTLNQEKLYKSVAQLATGFTMNDQVKLKDESFNVYEIDVKFNNAIEAIKSPRVLGMTSYNLMLHDLENPDKPFRVPSEEDRKSSVYRKLNRQKAIEILTRKYNEEQLLSSYDPEERKILELLNIYRYDLETLRYVLYVGRVQRTDFIDIQYRSINPELSAYIVNQVVTEFLRNYETSRNQQTVQNIETLKKLVDQKREELDAKIGNIKTMGTLDATVESSSTLEQISNFESRLADEKAILTSAQLASQQVTQRLSEMESTSTQNAAATNSSNTELATLREKMNDASAEYQNKGGNDPELYNKYKKARNDYSAKLMAMASAAPTAANPGTTKADLQQKKSDLDLQVRSAQQNIAAYEQKIRQLNSSMGATASRGANNLALQKEVELAQQEYESIKSRYDAAVNNKIAPMDNFHQILYGQPAVEPEPSKRLIIIAMAGMAVAVFCCILIIFLEYIDVSIKTPTQFLRILELKLLGVVNRINLKKTPLEEIFSDPTLKQHDTAAFRELLRKLRFEMENSGKKIFLLTSAKPGEGKSTILKALAYSLSLTRKKVLIIDTQFPHNTLTQEFEAKPVLEGFNAGNEFNIVQLHDLISPTSMENVFIIGCEGGEYTPSEILKPGNLLEHLRSLTYEFDYILMEGAALNERADSKELMQYADTIITVVSARSGVNQTDRETISFLHSLNGKFSGAVLNFVEPENIDL